VSVESPAPGSTPLGQVQVATYAARRRTLMFLGLAAITGLALIGGIEEWIRAVGDRAADDPKRAISEIAYVLQVLAATISLSLIGLALVVVRVSWRVHAARRFPPPGMTLAVDVSVVEGASAVRRSYVGFLLGSILGGLAVVLPYMLWRILSVMVSAPVG